MTPISQEDRELLNSLETYQLYKNSPFNKKNVAEPSNWKKLWGATLSALMLMCVVPWVFSIFVIAVSFFVHYLFCSVSWVFVTIISLFRILGKA
jgi:hypothetical protein